MTLSKNHTLKVKTAENGDLLVSLKKPKKVITAWTIKNEKA